MSLWFVPLAPSPAADAGGFTPLFSGKDLTGWKAFAREAKDALTKSIDPKRSWRVEDGTLVCTGQPIGYLATEKEYGDYVLRLKWRFPKDSKGGNSGVLLHCQKEDRVWPTSIEAQLRSGRAGDLWLNTPPDVKLTFDPARRDAKDMAMRHVFRDPRDSDVEKPLGEWNTYEITCTGGNIVLVVNGRKVNEGTDGNLKKGRIALQSEGAEIHFKDIEIKPIR